MDPRRAVLAIVVASLLAACGPDAPPLPEGASVPGKGFAMYLWCWGGERPDPALLRLTGVAGVSLDVSEDPAGPAAAGLRWYVGHAAGKGILNLRKEGAAEASRGERPVRSPCLSDPRTREELAARVDRALDRHRGTGLDALAIEDEISVTIGASPVDTCFSPWCRERFRGWLERRYGDPATLNAVWGTALGSFAEAEPETTAEVRARVLGTPRSGWNLARWADHRAFMDDVLAETVEALRARIREKAPGLPAGILGGLFPAAFGGQDPARTVRAMDFVEVYESGAMKPLVRALAAPGAVVISTIWSGGGDERVARHRLWNSFAHGEDGVVIWSNREFVKDGEPTAYARWLSRDLREIGGPLGETLAAARPAPASVAILLSMPSVRVGWMLDSEEDGTTWPRRLTSHESGHSSALLAREAAARLLEDAGTPFGYLTDADVEEGRLGAGIRALVLPRISALSDRAAAEIAAFVARGGVVIADHGPALFTERAVARGRGALDALFGVGRRDDPPREKGGWPDRDAGELYRGFVAVEPGLLVADGKVAARADGVPVGVRKRTGEGFAVYLNLGLPDYLRARQSRGGEGLRDLVKGYLEEAGIRPPLGVTTAESRPADRVLRLLYDTPDGAVLVLQRNWQVEDLAGVPGDLSGTRDLGAETVRVVLPEPREVTNVRTGKSYGRVQVVEDVLPPLEANVYRLR